MIASVVCNVAAAVVGVYKALTLLLVKYISLPPEVCALKALAS